MHHRFQPELWNVVAYAALVSVGFGYVIFLCGPSRSDAFAALGFCAFMISVASVALNWQSWTQPMKLPKQSPRPESLFEVVTFLCWAGAAVFFLAALPEETRRPEFLISNKPLWAFLWAAMVVQQVRRVVNCGLATPMTEPSNAADSR